jgi:hypothetical protein
MHNTDVIKKIIKSSFSHEIITAKWLKKHYNTSLKEEPIKALSPNFF